VNTNFVRAHLKCKSRSLSCKFTLFCKLRRAGSFEGSAEKSLEES